MCLVQVMLGSMMHPLHTYLSKSNVCIAWKSLLAFQTFRSVHCPQCKCCAVISALADHTEDCHVQHIEVNWVFAAASNDIFLSLFVEKPQLLPMT